MSDKNPFSFWNTDWVQAQRKYMEACSALGGSKGNNAARAGAGNGQDANPWNKALEFWWQSISNSAPDETRDFYGKLVDQTQSFFFVTDQLSRLMQGLAEVGESVDNWQGKLEQQFEEMKAAVSSGHGDIGQMFNGMFGAWQLPMDTMQRTFSSGSVFPGDFLQGIKPDAMEQATDKFLSVPGVGYSRESQEQAQEGLRLWARYQRTAHEYQTQMNKVGVQALDIIKQRIIKMAGNDEQITTLRELYDLWVECNEKAYADYVFTKEYSELYGRLTNDLMALKSHGQGIIDETTSAMGIPTRKGMETVQKRQQQMRRELIASKSRIEELESILEQVRKLERKVEALNSRRSQSTAQATTTSRKKAGKKKVSSKKKTGRKTGR